jgi:hypothetical protein
MVLTTQDGLVAAMAAGRSVQFLKASATGATAGAIMALFRVAGMPGAATAPTTAAGQALSRTSVGALPIPAPATVTYASSYEAVMQTAGALLVADRLVETGGLAGNVTTAQAVGSVALPARATGATDVELWIEIYTALGSTASPSVTATYTNQAGTAGKVATLTGGLPGSAAANRAYQLSLAAGDTGVQSVQDVTLGTSTGTAGAFGVVLRRTLLSGAVPGNNSGFVQGYAETDLQIVPDDACLELLCLASATTTGLINGAVGISQG